MLLQVLHAVQAGTLTALEPDVRGGTGGAAGIDKTLGGVLAALGR